MKKLLIILGIIALVVGLTFFITNEIILNLQYQEPDSQSGLHNERAYGSVETNAEFNRFLGTDYIYITPISPENQELNYRGIYFNNNILNLRGELNVPKSAFEDLAREHNAVITSFIRSDTMGNNYTFTFNRTFTYEELREMAIYFERFEIVQNARVSIDFSPPSSQTVIRNELNTTSYVRQGIPQVNYLRRWGLAAINAPGAWQYRSIMSEIGVLVKDTSFYQNHEFLPIDIIPETQHYMIHQPFHPRHGTHVAGIIGARPNTIRNTSGTAPNARMHGFQLQYIAYYNEYGEPQASAIIRCSTRQMNLMAFYIEYLDVRVINASIGWNLYEFASSRGNPNADRRVDAIANYFEEVFLRLINNDHEFVFVTSAGNQFETNVEEPSIRYTICTNSCGDGDYCVGFRRSPHGELAGIYGAEFSPFSRMENEQVRERIITVGATQYDGNLASFSQRGSSVDVNAPGVRIYNTLFSVDRYGFMQGTSMAAPFVSGVATMIFGINPDFTGAEVKDIIVRTADRDNNNLINAYEAVREAIARTEMGSEMELPDELPATGGVDPLEVREAYMEFLRRRSFEMYFSNDWWTYPFDRYAIIDIDGDRIPELIVRGGDGFGWYTDLIFTFDITQERVVFVSSLYSWLGGRYSQQHRALVCIPVRTHVSGGIFEFITLNDLKSNSISFTISFDESSYFSPAYNIITYGEWYEDNSASRDISEEERRRYLNDVIEIEFFDIPLLARNTSIQYEIQHLLIGEWQNQWDETLIFQSNGRFNEIWVDWERANGTYSIRGDNTLHITITTNFRDVDGYFTLEEEETFIWVDSDVNIAHGEWHISQERLNLGGRVFVREIETPEEEPPEINEYVSSRENINPSDFIGRTREQVIYQLGQPVDEGWIRIGQTTWQYISIPNRFDIAFYYFYGEPISWIYLRGDNFAIDNIAWRQDIAVLSMLFDGYVCPRLGRSGGFRHGDYVIFFDIWSAERTVPSLARITYWRDNRCICNNR